MSCQALNNVTNKKGNSEKSVNQIVSVLTRTKEYLAIEHNKKHFFHPYIRILSYSVMYCLNIGIKSIFNIEFDSFFIKRLSVKLNLTKQLCLLYF